MPISRSQVLESAKKFRDQSVFCIWLCIWPIMVFVNADGLEIFYGNTKELIKPLDYKMLEPWLKTGLLTSNGAKWRTRRRILTPSFHDTNLLNSFLPIFNEQSKICISRFEKVVNKPTNLYPYITACTLDIICEAAMGTSSMAQIENSTYVDAVAKISDIIIRRWTTPWIWPDFLFKMSSLGRDHDNTLKILHDYTRKFINIRTAEFEKNQLNTKRMAFLDTLLTKMHEERLTMDDIQEEVDTFMFEGHDTTAAALSFALFLIALHPDVQQKLYNEIDQIFSDDVERACTMDDLKQMDYLECVIKESLRLLPSVPGILREAQEDFIYNGHKILAGTRCVISILAIHLDPKYYPEPNKFDPERFRPENTAQRSPYAFIPFSAGSRNCIGMNEKTSFLFYPFNHNGKLASVCLGQRFALIEEKVFLSTLLRKFSLTTEQKVEDLHLASEIILRPTVPIQITLKYRQE
ncbi:unnamed protein product [Didymodactylos carnosus]|uniref:Cytochrome P450 n=2 Tax=Didymodactylos carnosus TaxID=1234261 RepID=A0A813TZV9_9BILA|nr:unnamed protein product [Didymodactylos carnosus]CAF3606050.1 unnamed protein product [Didymodactylos carnosus]